MRRRAFFGFAASLVVLLAIVAAILGRMILHEPVSYQQIAVPSGQERRELSGEFYSNVWHMMDSVRNPGDEQWGAIVTANQINCYFEEDFLRAKPFRMPDDFHSPRVQIEPGHLRIAFRYGEGFWSSVVTLDLNAWLVANEPNSVAVEVLGLHAGSLPCSTQSLLERVADYARNFNLEVTWYRYNGHPVALLRYQSDQPNPPVVLQRLELQDGKLLIAGRSSEGAAVRMVSMTGSGGE
jgi:hypothetical protein